ncbi:MAG: phosphotransferase [Parcubacteria group bacterium]|jgi:Ser/Thr protein kinase RdoA (MazF antagonist)
MKSKKSLDWEEEEIGSYLSSTGIIKGCCFVFKIDRGIESKNYIISVGNRSNYKYLLKIYSENSYGEILYEIEILNKLNSCFEKKFFPIISKEVFFIDKKPSILLKYIKGNILSKKEISPSLVRKIAKKQASMHLSLADFRPKHKRTRLSIYNFSFADFNLGNINDSRKKILQKEVGELKQEICLFEKIKFRKSIIHEDLSMENIILTKNDGVSFIDFGESHYAEMISDVAIAIKEIIIRNKGVDFGLMRDYLDSYRKTISLAKEEVGALLFLLKRRTAFMLAYLLNKQGLDNEIEFTKKIDEEIRMLKLLRKNSQLIKNFIKNYE